MTLGIFQKLSDAISGPDPTGKRTEERWVAEKKRLLDSGPYQNTREHDRALKNVTDLYREILNRNIDYIILLSNVTGQTVNQVEMHHLLKENLSHADFRYCALDVKTKDIAAYSSESLMLVAIFSILGGTIKGFGTVGDNTFFSAKVFEYLSSERDFPQAYFFKGVMTKYGPVPQSTPDLDMAETALQMALEKGVTRAALELENISLHEILRNYKPKYYTVDKWDDWVRDS